MVPTRLSAGTLPYVDVRCRPATQAETGAERIVQFAYLPFEPQLSEECS